MIVVKKLLLVMVMTGIRVRQSHNTAVGSRSTHVHVSIPAESQSAKTHRCNRLVGKRETAKDVISLSCTRVRLQRTEEMDFVTAMYDGIVSAQRTGNCSIRSNLFKFKVKVAAYSPAETTLICDFMINKQLLPYFLSRSKYLFPQISQE
jgi:hypothetical protein